MKAVDPPNSLLSFHSYSKTPSFSPVFSFYIFAFGTEVTTPNPRIVAIISYDRTRHTIHPFPSASAIAIAHSPLPHVYPAISHIRPRYHLFALLLSTFYSIQLYFVSFRSSLPCISM